MTPRDRNVLVVVVALAALAAGWLLVVQPKRAAAAKLGSSIQSEQAQLSTVEARVAADEQARASFPADYAELAELGEAVPQDDQVPSLIAEIQSAATASGVDFEALHVTPSSGGTTTATTGTSGTAALAPGVNPGGGAFDSEQFTFTFSGEFFNLSNFLARLEGFVVANGPTVRVRGRLMTLNALDLSAAPKGFPRMVADVSATTYLLPASQGSLNGATAAGPAGSPAGLANPAAGAGSSANASGSGAPAGGSGGTTAPAAAISGSALSGIPR